MTMKTSQMKLIINYLLIIEIYINSICSIYLMFVYYKNYCIWKGMVILQELNKLVSHEIGKYRIDYVNV